MNWTHIDKDLPDMGKQILVYSPIYEKENEALLFRIINSQFLRFAIEVKYWMYLIPPEKKNENEQDYS